MRVLIMSDMEGVSGIVVWEQVDGGEAMFEEGRLLYTEEINAAVRGAKTAGADEIVVVDCHGAGKGWTFDSLIPPVRAREMIERAAGQSRLAYTCARVFERRRSRS